MQSLSLGFLEKLLGRNYLGKGFHKELSFHFLTGSEWGENEKKKGNSFLDSVFTYKL